MQVHAPRRVGFPFAHWVSGWRIGRINAWGPAAWHTRRDRPPFPDPQSLPGRTALLLDGFAETRLCRRVACDEVAAYRADVLAGQLPELLACGVDPTARHWVRRAVVAVTRWPDHWQRGFLLDEASRDALWQAFAVPVFEYLMTADCRLLAAECEAHDGLHVVGGNDANLWLSAVAEGESGFRLDWQPSRCGCGSWAPRFHVLPGVDAWTRFAAAAGD
jgi:hypothetical protein